MHDKIEKLKTGAIIQHGKHNNRIYLMDVGKSKVLETISLLDKLALKNQYGKIFAKVPNWTRSKFEREGYVNEAIVPRFFRGKIAGSFMAKFFDPARAGNRNATETNQIIEMAKGKQCSIAKQTLPSGYRLGKLDHKNAAELAELYAEVFKSYPFPIHSSEYILKTMFEDVDYFGIHKGKQLVAAASAEKDICCSNVEMTDFATLPEFRGKSFSSYLLHAMEICMYEIGISTWFTIARSLSEGMNITFAKADYKFAGTLINNTNICGKVENMNVWYKTIIKK